LQVRWRHLHRVGRTVAWSVADDQGALDGVGVGPSWSISAKREATYVGKSCARIASTSSVVSLIGPQGCGLVLRGLLPSISEIPLRSSSCS
jgi:hypothetical protein